MPSMSFVIGTSPPPTSELDPATVAAAVAAIITLLAALIGAYISIVLSRRQFRKVLTYQVISNTPVLGIDEKQVGNIRVLIGDTEVKDARLVVLKIWNSGRRPVTSEDYAVPIEIQFKGGKILTSQVVNEDIRQSREVIDSQTLDTITLRPLLLNPKDSITITSIVSYFTGHVSVYARIMDGEVIYAQ